MNFTLRTKVTAFVAVVVITISMISTFLFISAQKRGIERELIARGFALSESLSRAIDEGLAAEDLNLIKSVEDIVHTKDVVLVQAFSTLWLGVASAPADQLNVPPVPAAVEHYKTTRKEQGHFYIDEGGLLISIPRCCWIRTIPGFLRSLLDMYDSRFQPGRLGNRLKMR